MGTRGPAVTGPMGGKLAPKSVLFTQRAVRPLCLLPGGGDDKTWTPGTPPLPGPQSGGGGGYGPATVLQRSTGTTPFATNKTRRDLKWRRKGCSPSNSAVSTVRGGSPVEILDPNRALVGQGPRGGGGRQLPTQTKAKQWLRWDAVN